MGDGVWMEVDHDVVGWEQLPESTLDFLTLTWTQLEPYYRDLESRPLNADTLNQWMADWGRLGKHLDESYWRRWVDTTLDTLVKAAQERFSTFLVQVYEPAQEAEQRLKQKLLASGLHPQMFEAPLRNIAADARLF